MMEKPVLFVRSKNFVTMKIKNYYVNIFLIDNLQDLFGQYRLFEVQGLHDKIRDFQKKRQRIINKLSRKLKHPITIIERNNKHYLVTKNEIEIIAKLPVDYPKVGGGKFKFLDTKENFELNFNSQDFYDRAICERFLQFETQGSLFNERDLWQPATGQPFFTKTPKRIKGIDVFTGYRVRAIDLGDKWGIMVDITKKYVKPIPLPTHLTSEIFYEQYKGKRYLYKFGSNWYTVKLEEFEYATAKEYSYIKNDKEITLIEDIRNSTPFPHSKTLANLPEDCSVLLYYGAGSETQGTASGLCYEVIGTEDFEGSQIHRNSIIPPLYRAKGMNWFRTKYLNNIRFGTQKVFLQPKLYRIDCDIFDYPDYLIGDSQELISSSFSYPNRLIKERFDKLNDPNCGFYKPQDKQFCPQYIFLPRSVHNAMGATFTEALIDAVNSMYPWDEYKPEIKFYEDKFSGNRNYVKLGKRIVETVGKFKSNGVNPHALIMIPDFRRGNREHDELAALLVQELGKKSYGISCSIIHTNMVKECYEERTNKEGEIFYVVKQDIHNKKFDKRGKLKGYLRNVANKQVLLSNNKYPYVLKTPLNADMTIGIDVKNYLAGFLFTDKYAKNNRKVFRPAKNHEKLTKNLMVKTLVEIIEDEAAFSLGSMRNFVFHRDGHFFDEEIEGIKEAFRILKEEKHILTEEASFTLVEIPKKTQVSLRFLDSWFDNNTKQYNCNNPRIGSYWIINEHKAYICTTGKEFHRGGTSNSLLVNKVNGEMDFKAILQDIFFLSTLAYTKPDDCSRIPMSIKVLDIHLQDQASKYKKNEYANLLDLEDEDYK